MKIKELKERLPANKNKILSVSGALLMGLAALCLESSVAAGALGISGLLLLFWAGRLAVTRSDVIVNGVALWLGHCLRFAGAYGGVFIYAAFYCLFFVPYCAFLFGAVCLDRAVWNKKHLALPIVPVAYALVAFITVAFNFGNVFNLMGCLISVPVIAAGTSAVCEYALTFILLWILMSVPAVFLAPYRHTKAASAVIAVVLSAALLISGCTIRGRWDEPDYTLKVALATSFEYDFDGEMQTAEEQLKLFKAAIKQAAEQDAKLLVLNEEYFFWKEEDAGWMLENISDVVHKYRIPTLIGVYISRGDEARAVNEAVFFDFAGQIQYTYVKNNLIPFIESLDCENGPEEPAVFRTEIDGHELDLAYVICFDVNDEVYLRSIPSTTELLIVPSWDWDTGNLEQKRTAVRSATLGLTMLKHSYDGFSHVSIPNGDVTETVDFRGQYETVRTVAVPVWER